VLGLQNEIPNLNCDKSRFSRESQLKLRHFVTLQNNSIKSCQVAFVDNHFVGSPRGNKSECYDIKSVYEDAPERLQLVDKSNRFVVVDVANVQQVVYGSS
jgi:hypothetical protein